MNPDDIIKLLDQLGQRLSPAAQYAFQLAVKQQIIDGITYVLFLVIFGLALAVSLKFTFKYFKLYNEYQEGNTYRSSNKYDSPVAITTTISCILFAVFCFALVAMGGSVLTKIFNPEYAALRDLISIVSGNK